MAYQVFFDSNFSYCVFYEMSHPHNESDFSKVICFAHNLTHEHGIFFSDEITENRTHVISKFFVLASLFKAHF